MMAQLSRVLTLILSVATLFGSKQEFDGGKPGTG